MKRFFAGLLMVIGTLTLIMALVSGAAIFYFLRAEKPIAEQTMLEIDFNEPFVEYIPEDTTARAVMGQLPRVMDLLTTLKLASTDPRVKGIVARLGRCRMGTATLQEIRDAILLFRENGKKTIAHAQSFGEFGPGNGAYYLATAFEEIYLQPSGDLGLTGIKVETPFVKKSLDKLGLVPRLDHREDYKNAMNLLTEEKYTPAHKEALQQMILSRFDQMIQDIAQSRGLEFDYLTQLVDKGPFSAHHAFAEKLIDGLNYWDEVSTKIKEEVGPDTDILPFGQYLSRIDPPETGDTAFALIYGVGAVQSGSSGYNPMSGDMMMGSETIVKAFRSAVEDDSVSAIIFRIDSPGGSYIASDTIWRETVRARDSGKPLIVSMGDVAASGGYFVACAADKIVAQPGTITGSIGVVAGKVLTKGLWDKLGVSWDEIQTSKNASIWSNLRDYSPEQWDKFQGWLDRIYDDFITKVADGRNLPKENVLEIAGGRIWTGQDAKQIGLVDELGGLYEAVGLAKEAVNIPQFELVRLKTFPEEKTFIELILEKGFPTSIRLGEREALATYVFKFMGPIAQLLEESGLTFSPGELRIPKAYYSF